MDNIRAGVDSTVGDGWHVVHYVCIAAVERLCSDGSLEVGKILFTACEQPDYVTEGLLIAAERINAAVDEEAD